MKNITTTVVCMYLFAACGAITSLLDSMLQRYLQTVQGEIWFSMAASLPALFDVIAIYLFSRQNISLYRITQISCMICLVGLMFLSYLSIPSIVFGRGFAGVIFSQFPFLCQQVAIEKKQALFYAVGLSGYIVAPLFFSFVDNIEWTLAFCVIICISCMLISPWINEKQYLPPSIGTSSPPSSYIFATLIASNLSASSTLYLVSPLLVWKNESNSQIAWMVSMVIGVQIIVSLGLSKLTYCAYQLNRYCVCYMMGVYLACTILIDLISIFWIQTALLMLSAPISIFMCTLIEMVHDHPWFSMSTKGMMDSSIYVIGPLINMTFLWHHSLPFFIQFLGWTAMFCFCNAPSSAVSHS